MKYELYKLGIIVKPEGKPIYSEMATNVTIEDESGGTFVCVTQSSSVGGSISIDADEWPAIKAAIDEMFIECARINCDMPESEAQP